MTREDDSSLHNQEDTTIREKKRSDLHNRYDIVKEHENSIFLSIHQNKFSGQQYNGTQVFYSPNNEASQTLAEYIQKFVIENIQTKNTRQIKRGGDEYFILYNVEVPAVLVECGFISNPEEAYKLLDDSYQATFSYVVFSAVANFIYNN